MPSRRPILDVTEVDVHVKAEQLLDYLDAANAGDDPRIFQWGNGLARVLETNRGYTLQPLDDRTLLFECERAVDWRRDRGSGQRRVSVSCPAHKDVVNHLASRGQWPGLPQLAMVAHAPAILEDGSLLQSNGYNRPSGIYLGLDTGLQVPPLPADPTEDDARRASLGLQDILSEYRFASPEDRGNAFGLMVARVLKPLMGKLARLPLFALDAPTQGSGKGLLINIAATIAQGFPAVSQFVEGGRNADEEMRKRITSILLGGHDFVHFDNLEISLDSGSLAALITADTWVDRALGTNTHLRLPIETTFAASGNNLRIAGDLGRRIVAIRIDTGSATPFLRTFRHMDLLGDVTRERGQLLGNILTLARRWVQLGSPPPLQRVIMGSFQRFADVVGGVLAVAGIEGWLGNLNRFVAEENTDVQEWAVFLRAWYSLWGEQPIPATVVAQAYLTAEHRYDDLRSSFPNVLKPYTDVDRAKLPVTLAYHLRQHRDQVFDDLKLHRHSRDRSNTTLWQVVGAGDTQPDAGDGAGDGSPPETHVLQIALPEGPPPTRAHASDSAPAGDAGHDVPRPALFFEKESPIQPRVKKAKTSPASPASPAETPGVARARVHARTRAFASRARVAVDTETTGLHAWHGAKIRLLQVAPETEAYDLFKHPDILEIWRPLLEGHGPNVVYHNAKFDLAMLRASGLHLPPWEKVDDTYLASVLLDNAAGPRPKQSLKALAQRYLNRDLPKEMQKSDWSAEQLTQEQVDYAKADAQATLDLADILIPQIDEQGLRKAYDIERAILPIIVELGLRGVRIDPQLWAPLAANAERNLARYEVALKGLAGEDFNPRSPSQIQKILEARGISIPSTSESYLQDHAGDPFVDALLGYREWTKGVTTYGVSVLKALDDDQRFHADYNQADTRTGRMTADIIHQMPRSGGYREAVRPIEGRVLLKADYSQLQVVIVADLAKAQSMIDAFNAKRDIHTETARLVLGSSDVTPDQRQAAKALNFGLLFGAGAATLQRHAANTYGVHWTLEQAQAMRDKFFMAYPEIKAWHRNRPGVEYHPEMPWPDNQVDLPVDLASDSGRRRLGVSKYTEKHNSPVQMMEVDGVKCGLKLLDDRLKASGLDAQIVMVVHDEVDLEAAAEDAEAVRDITQQALEEGMNQWLLHTRAIIEVEIRRDWHGTKL